MENHGQSVQDDSYIMEFGDDEELKVDLGAEKIIAAEKEYQKIVVEVKKFLNESVMYD